MNIPAYPSCRHPLAVVTKSGILSNGVTSTKLPAGTIVYCNEESVRACQLCGKRLCKKHNCDCETLPVSDL